MTDPQQSVGLGAAKHFRGQNPAGGTAITYYLKSAPSGDVKITITTVTGEVVREIDGTKDAGLNRVQWNLAPNPPQGQGQGRGGAGRGRGGGGRGGRGGPSFTAPNNAVAPGTYIVKLSVAGKELMSTVLVEADQLQ